jgi:PAS domain S-box-containing protein
MLSFSSGGGDAGRLLRQGDFINHTLGAPEGWPQALKTLVGVMLGSKQPMFIAWGEDLTLLYNDGYAEILAGKHPAAMGRPFLDVWAEIADDLRPIVSQTLSGSPVHMDDITLIMERRGYPEETHFSFSYTPVRGENGRIDGFICPCTETTQQVMAERSRAKDNERQRRLFERAPGFITILSSPEHVFEFVNESYSRLFGGRQFVGRTVREVFPDLEGQGFFELLDQVYATNERYVAHHVPVQFQVTAGAPIDHRFLDFIYEPVTEDHGQVTGIFCEGHDVTEQVEAQAALRASEERYRQIVEGAEDFAIITQDENGTIQSWNRGAERLTGFAETEAVGQPSSIFFTEEDKAAGIPDHEMNRARQDGRFVNERWHRRKDGSRFWGSGLMMAVHGGGFLKMFRDRTAEHQAEAALRESEEQFRAFAQAVPNHVWTAPADGKLDWFNDRVLEYSGRTAEDLRGDGWASLVHPDDMPAAVQAWSKSVAEEDSYQSDFRLRSADGSYRWHIARAVRINGAENGRTRWIGTNTDIEDQKNAVAALAELNRTLEQQVAERTADRDRVWRNSRDLLVIHDLAGVFRAVNPAWQLILGYPPEDVVGRSFEALVWPDDLGLTTEALRAAVTRGDLTNFENRYRHKDGTPRWISWHTSKEGDLIFCYGRDVSLEKRRQAELEQAQEALRQSQKLEAMGQLTGGVAHDFNNLLTPIVGSLDLLHRRKLGGEREQRLIDGALQSAERAKTLVQRLLAFARRQPLQASAVNVSSLVNGMAELVASTSGPQIEMVIDVPADLPAAKADPNQLEMAILNLSVNARDAMPGGGTMTILARCDEVDADVAADLAPGRYIRLSVADTGTGMDAETLSRAIEPFYSTKGIGKGTGLGLSMVHGLASQLGGALRLWSRPGSGTKIDLWLPVSEDAVANAPIGVDEPSARRAGTALLVDDEDIVRMTTADMLADLGYDPVEATSAEVAVQMLESGRSFDVIVTDHLMPGMNGAQLAHLVRTRWPDTPVLIVSGYADADGIAADMPRLTKPFRQSDLQASLNDLLLGTR